LLDCNTTTATAHQFGSVILSSNDSILYGSTLFSLQTNGMALSVYTVTETESFYGSIIRSGNILYGMTSDGGAYGLGNIFSIHTDWSGYADLHDFGGADSSGSLTGDSASGANPYGTLALSGNVLYGMTYGTITAGPSKGNIFSIHTDGTAYTSLLEFNGINGENPGYGAFAISGNTMYGTTIYGGSSNNGILFSIHTDGSGYTKLIDFNVSNGSMPFGSVILAGNVLYGNTIGGGLNGKGLIYSIHTDGTGYRDLLDFNGTNGQSPIGTLIISGSTLYGTTGNGGANNYGTIFSIDTNGTGYRDLFDFNTIKWHWTSCSIITCRKYFIRNNRSRRDL
jgi:uncharacterized repeat protein (TIGR03803 family)